MIRRDSIDKFSHTSDKKLKVQEKQMIKLSKWNKTSSLVFITTVYILVK